MAKPLIVGLDIGTTTGISVHDLSKNLLYLKSRKHFSSSNIIKQITIFGTPVLIATDKKNIPQKIRKIAARFNAKVYSPDHDLTVEEKEKAVNVNMKDTHERDALASALFAFKSYYSQFSTIDNNLDRMGLKKYSERVKELIVRREAKNIAEAIEKALPREKEKVFEAPTKTETELDFKGRSQELERKLKEERHRYEILKEYSDKLENKNRSLELLKQEYQEEQMKKNEETRKQVIKEKEIRNREILIKQLKFELQKQRSMKRAFEDKVKEETELKEIVNENMVPVVIIEDYTKESILDAHRRFNITGKAIWVKNMRASKVTSRKLITLKPKVLIGEVERDIKKILNNGKIIVVDNIKPRMKLNYAFVTPEEITSEIKKIEKKNFLKWLEEYRQRY